MNVITAALATFFWVTLVIGFATLVIGCADGPNQLSATVTKATGWLTILLSGLGIIGTFILELLSILVEKKKAETKSVAEIPFKGLRRSHLAPKPRIDSAGDEVPPHSELQGTRIDNGLER